MQSLRAAEMALSIAVEGEEGEEGEEEVEDEVFRFFVGGVCTFSRSCSKCFCISHAWFGFLAPAPESARCLTLSNGVLPLLAGMLKFRL